MKQNNHKKNMIGTRVRRLTNKVVNVDRGIKKITLNGPNFDTAKSFLPKFRGNYICGIQNVYFSFWQKNSKYDSTFQIGSFEASLYEPLKPLMSLQVHCLCS